MDGGEQRRVQLQQGFAAREDHIAVLRARSPGGGDGVGQEVGRGELAAAFAIGADEVGVAERAGGAGAVAFAAGPEVTARKPAKYRRAACVGAFALQGLEYFFGGVGHKVAGGRRRRENRAKADYFTWYRLPPYVSCPRFPVYRRTRPDVQHDPRPGRGRPERQ
ncbi:hypothetical protein D3C71_1496070 [compost metagenome]